MTRLTATAAQSVILERKHLEQRAARVRGQVEARPGASQGRKMETVERNLNMLFLKEAEKQLDEIEAALGKYEKACQEAEMATAAQAQDQLLAEGGVETFKMGEVRTRDGWRWLVGKKRLSSAQVWAGETYAARYAMAHRSLVRSCANDNMGGGTEDATEAGQNARDDLARVRTHINRATGSDRLTELLDLVCGMGQTLRYLAGNDDRKASAYEVELKLALDMAGVAFKGRREAA